MGMPELVVTAVVVEGRTKSEVARCYGVSRRWVITLVQRYLAEGQAGLAPRSRRPHTSPHRTARSLEEEIVAIRKELDRGGHESGAATIAYHLQERHAGDGGDGLKVPAVSTIWRILSQRGFVTPQPHKRPKASYVRFAAEQPNERWQLDITHWLQPDGSDIEILNVIDDHSRLCLASRTPGGNAPTFKSGGVDACVRGAMTAHGEPASMLSDNAAVFTGRSRRGGRVALEVTLAGRGIAFRHCRPYHPQTCGKVERFHQTLKKWLARQPPATTPRSLQTQLDTFRRYYNTVRPHRALHRATPATAYAARPKATPTGIALADSHYRIRHDRIDATGVFTLRHNSHLHHIGIGRRHARTDILVLIQDLNIRVLHADTGELLRELTLDPDRDYQPTAKT